MDTLKLKETFEANGFSNTQANALTHALHNCSKQTSQLATKQELNDVRNELKHDIREVRNQINDVRDQVNDVRDQVKDIRNELLEIKKYMDKK